MNSWEKKAINAIGNVIEFWGFKHNHGRIWALLYMNNRPFSAVEIQEHLNLSKGSVSMMVRELETWKVVHRVRIDNNPSRHFVAETDVMQMITNVIHQREKGIISSMRQELENAEKDAEKKSSVPAEMIERLRHLRRLSFLFEEILHVLSKSNNLDMLLLLEKVDEFKHTLSERAKRDKNE